MNEKIVEMLHLSLEPVGIFLGNTSAICELEASPQKRNCVIPFVLAAAKGKITSLDEDGCTCPGEAVGACFGDGFTRLNPNIHVMLSQGLGEKAPAEAPLMLKEGERFFCDAETALKWRNNMPFSDKAYPRIVFAPLSRWSEVGTPDLVYVFANADQISALVTMQGFHNGKAVNTLAPFGAACHSIVYAAEQIDKEEPYAIMGLFDISQRSAALKDYLSMTMPYKLWEDMMNDLDKSCLTTHSWKELKKDCKRQIQVLEENMRIDFNEIDSVTFPGMNNGTGMMSARMYNDDSYRIIPTAIHSGGSIGNHKQNSSDDMNYIISGTGKAFCDGTEEALSPGVMHICPKGSEHSIVNTGEEDLVMLTIVVKK